MNEVRAVLLGPRAARGSLPDSGVEEGPEVVGMNKKKATIYVSMIAISVVAWLAGEGVLSGQFLAASFVVAALD